MQKVHLIGVGGIGMSALARILVQSGVTVSGSDQKASRMLDQLEEEGVAVHRGHDPALIQKGMKVVYSGDIKPENGEWQRAKALSLPVLHRAELLDELMQGRRALLVTGAHGKTTTTALLATTLREAGLDPSFVVGGILKSSQTNAKLGLGPLFVAEADESDGSFLRTPAFGAIVTNIDLEHMNYWQSEERLLAAFSQFFAAAKEESFLLWCCDDQRLAKMRPRGVSYGFSQEANLRIISFAQERRGILFSLQFKGMEHRDIFLPLFGRHNALNGAAVFGLSLQLQIPAQAVREAFAKFQGVERRLELRATIKKVDFYDDYAHHPTEIQATLKALRGVAQERRIVALFQPHRYSRVQDLFDAFAPALQEADELVLTDIYGAGETPIPGVTSQHLYQQMRRVFGSRLHFFSREQLEQRVLELLRPHDVVIALGAGDIGQLMGSIASKWQEMEKRWRVAILSGGASPEHEVSLLSAENVASWADPSIYELIPLGIGKRGHWRMGEEARRSFSEEGDARREKMPTSLFEELMHCDLAVPVLHGPRGEDGMVQGFLDTLQIPYVGCGYGAASLCMNKRWTKEVALCHQIPTAPFLSLTADEERTSLAERIEKLFSYPVWVKPLHLGSSVGISRVDRREELEEKILHAFSFDQEILIEKHIEGKQIEFAILGNEFLWAGPPCEILNEGQFVTYEGKYGKKAFPYQIPASLPEERLQQGIELAKKTYQVLGCQGMARVDFFFDQEGNFWLNEVNPFPGCTDTSAFPMICRAAGVPFSEVFDRLVISALYRHRRSLFMVFSF